MTSTVIRRLLYDEPHRRLRTTFTSGDVYDHDAVQPEVVADARAAVSDRRVFGANIRDCFARRPIDS